MIQDDIGKSLHDKASKGEALSDSEEQQLQAWYAQQDQSEFIQLIVKEEPLSGLQAQIDAALAQLVNLSNRIQQIAVENERIRKENTILLHRLSQRLGSRPA